MKTKNLGLILLLPFILMACGIEFRYYTRINPDGTIYKRIAAVGDSSNVYKHPFSFDVSNGWNVSYEKEIKEGDTLFVAIAEKTFQSVAELNKELHLANDSSDKDNIITKYEKHFRWFFTFHNYSETFLQRFPYKHFSIEDYLSEDELAYFLEDDTACIEGLTKAEQKKFDDEGEKKFWDFISKSIAYEYFSLINNYALQKGDRLLGIEDTIAIQQLIDGIAFENDGPELKELCSLIDQIVDVKWVSEAYEAGYFGEFERELNEEMLLLRDDKYVIEIEMPGLLYDTNAHIAEKNMAQWQFERGRFSYRDYKLFVEYRTVNYWAFVVIVIVFAILIRVFLRKKKMLL